jgi:Flagellar hook-length control protein FliK
MRLLEPSACAMPIAINPSFSPVAAQAATAMPVVLQSGSVITAQVLQVAGNAVQIAIAGQPINVLSQVPLQAGQTLQLAVSQTSDGIRLAVVNQQPAATPNQGVSQSAGPSPSQGNAPAISDTVTLAPAAVASIAPQTSPAAAAPTNQLTRQEALAVTVAAQNAATVQTSLAPLFANLGVAATLNNLPPPLQQAIAQVLSQQVNLDQSLTGSDIKQAFQSSGLFLEATLASGSVAPSTTTPDLKAALIVLRQVLTTSLNSLAAQGSTAAPATTPQQGAPQPAAIVRGAPQPAAAAQAAVVQSGAAAPAVQPGTVATAPAATVLQGATLATAVAPQATTAAAIVLEQGIQALVQAALQATPEPVTITLVPGTQTTASPALAPQLLPEVTATQVASNILAASTTSETTTPASTAADAAARAAASNAAINLLQEVLQAESLTAGMSSRLLLTNSAMLSLLPAVAGARASNVDEAELTHTNVPPPPISGAVPTAQPVVAATLVTNSPAETAIHHLIADTEGALARQTLLQVASLPDRADAAGVRIDAAGPRWNFEIPFATPQGTAMAQFEISRDGGGKEAAAAQRVWRARFSLDVEPAGPVHALISFSGERTSVRMWAERPKTAAQLRAGAGELSQALALAELKPGDIVIRDGAPPQSAPAKAGHFLDRAL